MRTVPFATSTTIGASRRMPQGCEVDFFVDFEFRSRILQMAIGVVFNEAVRLMVRAFERRAMALYGRQAAAVAPGSPAPSATG